MAPIKWLVVLLLAGCTTPTLRIITLPPIIETRVDTRTNFVVHVEHVAKVIAPEKLQCPQDPPEPFILSPPMAGVYIAELTAVADQCRANLEALSAK